MMCQKWFVKWWTIVKIKVNKDIDKILIGNDFFKTCEVANILKLDKCWKLSASA